MSRYYTVVTPLGEFKDIKSAADTHGLSPTSMRNLMKEGFPQYHLLGKKGEKEKMGTVFADRGYYFFLGKEYGTLRELAKAAKISQGSVRAFLLKGDGLNLETGLGGAATGRKRQGQSVTIDGVLYDSISQASSSTGIFYSVLYRYCARENSYTVKSADLAAIGRGRGQGIIACTPLGVFPSIKEAADAHGISDAALYHRVKNGVAGYKFIK